MQKIPCPSCSEPNFPSDVMCWKCGAPLYKREQPAPAEPEPEPTPPAPEEVPAEQAEDVPETKPNAIMEAIIDLETEGPSYRKNFMLALFLAPAIGIAANLLFSIPFYLWLSADSLRSSAAAAFIVISSIGAAAAGFAAVYNGYGAAAGMVVYGISLIIFRFFAISPSIIAPPELWTYHLFSGYFIAYTGMFGAVLVLRAMKRRIAPPALSPKSPLNAKPGMAIALSVIAAIVLGLAIPRYRDSREQAANDPVRVVGSFCWAAASGWNGDAAGASYLLTNSLSTSGTSLKPQFPLPPSRTIKAMCLGRADKSVQSFTTGTQATVILQSSSESSLTPGIFKDGESMYQISFALTREDGAWRISSVPQVTLPGSL